jgi:anhydro-N-acetylmuramic acid kinase
MLLIGLMSGTSADGIDAALVEITGEGRNTRVRLLHFVCVPHAPEMRAAILRLCDPKAGAVADLCALNFALGERFAEAARAAADAAGVPLSEVDAVCSHGQTVWHQPTPLSVGGVEARGTLQIGEPAVIATRTGCKVIADFRAADVAAGGQGAPLVPYADWALLTSDTESRAVLNIGGIANVTHLPRNARMEDVIAFDTGPGNMVMDGMAFLLSVGQRTRDEGGAWAAKGTPNERVVSFLLEHPYFAAPPPKTTGREMFGADYVAAVRSFKGSGRNAGADLMATVTLLTAESIARAFRDFLGPRGGAETVIVGGGGIHNKMLMRMLAERLAPARLTTHAEFGIPDDAKEAVAFALLGYETLHGRPSNLPGATGAARAVILGSVTPAGRVG